jgi:DUF1365 family protein
MRLPTISVDIPIPCRWKKRGRFLNFDELDLLQSLGRWFSIDKWALSRFHSSDYYGDPTLSLAGLNQRATVHVLWRAGWPACTLGWCTAAGGLFYLAITFFSCYSGYCLGFALDSGRTLCCDVER